MLPLYGLASSLPPYRAAAVALMWSLLLSVSRAVSITGGSLKLKLQGGSTGTALNLPTLGGGSSPYTVQFAGDFGPTVTPIYLKSAAFPNTNFSCSSVSNTATSVTCTLPEAAGTSNKFTLTTSGQTLTGTDVINFPAPQIQVIFCLCV
eukprot:g40035.t1